MNVRLSLIFSFCLCFNLNLWAWGEKGHHIICHTGAKLIEDKYSKAVGIEKSLGKLMGRYKIALGHACNIPDNYWRAENLPALIDELNPPTHYFNAEHFVGTNPKGSTVADEIKKLPSLYEQLLVRYQGKNSQITNKPFSVFNSGTAPWRADELYELAKRAFGCFSEKTWNSNDLKFRIKNTLREFPESDFYSINDLTDQYYVCEKKRNRFNDLSAAVTILGLMGHFVGDLTQPYHATADYDGWATGQGGVHHYFETEVVEGLEGLEEAVLAKARDLSFQKEQMKKIDWPNVFSPKMSGMVALGMLKLAANSNQLKATISDLDRKAAVVKAGTILPLDTTRKDKKDGSVAAERRPADFPAVQKAFRDIIIERLALGAILYQDLLLQAWASGGKPRVDLSYPNSNRWVSLIYPLAPPFAIPQYDRAVLEAAVKSR